MLQPNKNKLGDMGSDPRFYSPKRSHPDDVFVWCEGTWCYRSEIEEMQHMSDDFTVLRAESPAWIKFFEDIENDRQEQQEILDVGYTL